MTERDAREMAERENAKGREGVVYVAVQVAQQQLGGSPSGGWYVRRETTKGAK